MKHDSWKADGIEAALEHECADRRSNRHSAGRASTADSEGRTFDKGAPDKLSKAPGAWKKERSNCSIDSGTG